MQVISKKLKKNNNSPRGVIPDTRKLFRNNSAWRIIISIVAFLTLSVNGFAFLSSKAFADAEVQFTVVIPDAALLEVELFNTDGTALGSTASIDVVPSLSSAGFNEKSMVVSVGTNNEWGYNLVMSVSNTALTSAESNTIANLVEDTTNHANGYTCTAETAGTCDFTLNSWGFRIDRATTLLSATNYIPVPSTLNLNKNATTTNGDPTYVSFGSRINATQEPGEYTTTITFAATANPEPDYMQEVTSSRLIALMPDNGDTATIYDKRDESDYEITRIDDENGEPFYWMTQNLRYMPTSGTVLYPATTNVTTQKTLTTVGELTSGFSYTEPRVQYNNDTTYGAYYNYCAASAGTVCNDSTQADATQDICPAGWRLPTQAEMQTIANASGANFNLALAGWYRSGTLYSAGSRGTWWSATAYNATNQYYLYYYGSWSAGRLSKLYGFSVRCVLAAPTMQSMTSSNIAEYLPNAGDTITMKDARDGKTYTVGKMADNKYWMLDNLALDLTDDDILNALDATNTAIDTTNDPGALAALKGTTLGTTSDKYATAKVANWTSSSSDSYSAPLVNMDSKDLVPQGESDPLKAEALEGSWKVGGYYNYCAASAGSYCYGNGTSAGTSSGNATSSICPKGWHMPSSDGGEYNTLYSAYSNASPSQYTAFRTAFHLPLSGYYDNGSANGQGSYGNFWSVTRTNNNLMYNLNANVRDIQPLGFNNRGIGNSVRCVLDS